MKKTMKDLMKDLMKDPYIYFNLGLFGLLFLIPSETLFVNIILIPICFLLQFISLFFIIRKYLSEKKLRTRRKNLTDTPNRK